MCVKIFRKVVESNEGKRVNGRHWKHIFIKTVALRASPSAGWFRFLFLSFVSWTALLSRARHKKGSFFWGSPESIFTNAKKPAQMVAGLTNRGENFDLGSHKENMRAATENDSQISNSLLTRGITIATSLRLHNPSKSNGSTNWLL